jgi:hypothetical protein
MGDSTSSFHGKRPTSHRPIGCHKKRGIPLASDCDEINDEATFGKGIPPYFEVHNKQLHVAFKWNHSEDD